MGILEQERAAIQALRTGNLSGLEPLVQLHQLRALRTAYEITRDPQLAEDVVADAFLAAYDHIKQYDDSRPFGPWFHRIVANGALKAIRRSRRSRGDEGLDGSLPSRSDPAPTPDNEVIGREGEREVLAAIEALPPGQRAVVVLRCYLDMDDATIAATLRCPLGTVRWRLFAARRRLRRVLTENSERGLEPWPKGGTY